MLDPETPVAFDRMLDHFAGREGRRGKLRLLVAGAAVLLILLAIAAAWRWKPLAGWVSSDQLAAWAGQISGHRVYFPAILGAFIVGGLLMIPVTLIDEKQSLL